MTEEKEFIFWSDAKAHEIISRKKYRYLEKEIPEFKQYVVKSSASISGVLHIGRMSDTVRGEAVVRSLRDLGKDAKLIWVAEDMDPLRKIPSGIPESFREYIGMPVSRIPDPFGCHKTYAEHFVSDYFEVLEQFVGVEIDIYFMSEEYKKGNFNYEIKKLIENRDVILEILNKYREKKLETFNPYQPICENCGKIITTKTIKIDNGKIYYRCEDYKFEKETAKGCGHEGVADPFKGNGKLVWKSEWAAQWHRFKVVSEGAGKEYIVPGSAFWINAEICERVLDFPAPVPIFYEHILIDGAKMSASVGNVVYPREWLEVAPPELLRFFFFKKIMKSRSFSWKDLPRLYDDYDKHAKVYFGMEKAENEKEEKHMKRLYEMSQVKEIKPYVPLPFSHALMLVQIFPNDNAIIESLKRSNHYREELHEYIMERINYARNYANKYLDRKINLLQDASLVKNKIDEEQRKFLRKFAEWLDHNRKASIDEIHNAIYQVARECGLNTKKAFKAIYLSLLNTTFGPRAASLIASLERDFIVKRFREV